MSPRLRVVDDGNGEAKPVRRKIEWRTVRLAFMLIASVAMAGSVIYFYLYPPGPVAISQGWFWAFVIAAYLAVKFMNRPGRAEVHHYYHGPKE
mgnify:CR=1 FL=1